MTRLACAAPALRLNVLGCTTHEKALIVNPQTELRIGVELDVIAVRVAAPRHYITIATMTRLSAHWRPARVAMRTATASSMNARVQSLNTLHRHPSPGSSSPTLRNEAHPRACPIGL